MKIKWADRVKGTVLNTFQIYSGKELSVYAGNATLYIIMSFVPLLVVVTAIINLLPGFDVDDLSTLLMTMLPDLSQVRELILGLLRNIARQPGVLVLSISTIVALYSASRGVAALHKAMAKVYDVKAPLKNILTVVLYTLLLLLIIPMLLIFHMLGDSLQEFLQELMPNSVVMIGLVMRILRIAALSISVLLVVLTYTLLDGRKNTILSQIPGALLTLLLWGSFTRGFAFFIPRFWKSASYYGPLASVFLVLMWLRTMMNILMIGAAYNRALEEEQAAQKAEKAAKAEETADVKERPETAGPEAAPAQEDCRKEAPAHEPKAEQTPDSVPRQSDVSE